MKKPTDLSKAQFYRIYGQPSEKNDFLFIEIGRNGELSVVKQNGDIERIRFKFKDLNDFSVLLQRLLDATNQFIHDSTPTTNKEVK